MLNFNDNFSKLHSELALLKSMNSEPTRQWIVNRLGTLWTWNVSAGQMPSTVKKKMFGSSWNTLPSGQQTVGKVLSIFEKVDGTIDPGLSSTWQY